LKLNVEEFEKYKKQFNSFLDNLGSEEKVGIIAHANCTDGMASTVFLVEILKKRYPLLKSNIMFLSYTAGALDKLGERYLNEGISKAFVLDLNADVSLFDEFENFRKKFDVLFIDHHPINPKLIIDNKVIKTISADCTSLTLFRFGEGLIDYDVWSWLVCIACVSEFSWKKEENLKFIQKYYPSYVPGDESSDLLKLVHKINSLVTYYSKDSMKAYQIILDKDFDKINLIHEEVNAETSRCLKDFEENAEVYFDKHLYFYFFKSRFSIGSTVSTILSVMHRGSTIIILSEVEETDLMKVSARNNGEPLLYSMNEMLKSGVVGLEGAMAGGHAPASGGSFLRKDIDKFKEQVKEFVNGKIN